MFPTHPGARRWRRVGDALFHKQLRRHMRPDGSMIEDSLSYHRFVVEMLVVQSPCRRVVPAVDAALSDRRRPPERLGVLTGEVPQFGDWDEGRVLADSSPAGCVAGSTLLALALSGKDVPAGAWDHHDELAWYADPALASQATKRRAPMGLGVRGGFHYAPKVTGGCGSRSGLAPRTSTPTSPLSGSGMASSGSCAIPGPAPTTGRSTSATAFARRPRIPCGAPTARTP